LKATPLISVIVTCYNQEQYLAQTLQSLVNQTYPNWECIVVNDGSSDGTAQVADEWQQKEPRIRCIHKPNGGVSSARNVALKLATGDFIQFLDGDDLLERTKLEQVVFFPEAKITVTHFAMFEGRCESLLPPFCELSQEMLHYDYVLTRWDLNFNIPIHTGIFAAEVLKGFEFNEQLKAKEDWLLWLHVFKQNDDAVFINKPLALYRMHPENMTKDARHMNHYTIKAYDFLYQQLNDREKQLLYSKVLNLYADETVFFSGKSAADYNEYMELVRGKKALGLMGSFMFRTLRKIGHFLSERENTK
jgi:glycosyltransferase involved in cell wall biosynthesis